MKQNYITKIFLTLAITLLSYSANAQTEYTYTLIDNGSYSYSVAAVPSTTTSNFQTSVQGYGFTILVPDGVTYTIDYFLGQAPTENRFDANLVGGSATEDAILFSNNLNAPVNIAAPNDAANPVVFVTLTVTGDPTSGNIRILENNSTEADTAGTQLDAYMQADTTDDATVNYSNRILTPTGLSGTISHSFSTLGVTTNTLEQIKIFPNPTNGIINIAGLDNEVVKASVYSINGQLVLTKSSNLDTINIADVAPGVYFLNIETTTANKVVKLVKQ
ncbi:MULTISPECIES: T9SS type A sorting domain-containing protein [Mesoflavibacter]|uniref:T9SS type A sorting domain-containing protein n=1 Tax=Mesoflavibacter profundi TaxID=2708110 RepID=A0ABT4RZV3_9FLAO|nr:MULTISPECIES: T9SS type A sorting domain-containing protein [Mesoflavibacter]MDA0177337.1 T9SS type A sorting domain-containing protein [Mesoflavibacter profundi]QIJ88255.1 hypothetical protein C7H62_0446 [Mesoflavibacter sp. HG96]QIJ90983.1 hypothetical protein C7H56_0446 [Mesoflavibacter sp. HG37]